MTGWRQRQVVPRFCSRKMSETHTGLRKDMEFKRPTGPLSPPLTLTRMALVAASAYVRPHTMPRTLRCVRPER